MMFSLEDHTGFMLLPPFLYHKNELKLIASHSPLCCDLGSLTPWVEACWQGKHIGS